LHDASELRPIQCWEWLSCDKIRCEAHSSGDLRCWLTKGNSCFDTAVGLTQRLSDRCASCPVFAANRSRSLGKRLSDQAVIDTLDALFMESAQLTSEVERLAVESRGKSKQVTLLSEIGRALQSTMEIDELLLVILTAVTAGDGLGFNRAFLLLADETGSSIRGRMAVGPTDPGEADRIWRAMENEGRSLGGILAALWSDGKVRNEGITSIARRMVLSLEPGSNVVADCLEEGASFVAVEARKDPKTKHLARLLRNDHFLVAPLLAEGRKLGAILADNFVTRRRISTEDVRLLETFASQAALAILNASLHERLQQRLSQLEQAYEQLSENHLQLLRAETQVALGGLAGTLVHDLRAPLVSVGLVARTAASKLGDDDPTRKSLEKIAEKALEMEDYLKGVARSAERKAKDAEPVDISDLVVDALELMRGLMMRSGVEGITRFNHGRARVSGDYVELRQIILSLLQNSLEAMPMGGTLTVETGVRGSMIEVAIEDTGVGIPEAVKSKVFSAFFTTKPEGSGLGLLTAKRIVTDWGGNITFESTEGRGTCFTVLLPACVDP
jgi:signal transduction histidine kinase